MRFFSLLTRSGKEGRGSSSLQSAAVATLGGAQISLTLLEKMTDGAPVPFLKAAAGTAVEVIKIARDIQANREECEDLSKRSASLLVVVLSSFDGKAESAIPTQLKLKVERLATSFQEVRTMLETIKERAGKRRALLYYFDNAEKLKSCSTQLDWAMQEFQVVSQVDLCLKDLERHEELLKGQEELRDVLRGGQTELRRGLNEVRDAINEQRAVDIILSLPSAVMPSNPKIFGRDEYVNNAVGLLLSGRSARIAILGPGGMGKTSVAIKVVHDPRVIEKFGKNRLWVACEQATSVPLLIELLAKVLELPTSRSGDRFNDIITFLESCDVLVLLLLDNFETPWDIEGQRSNVGDVLARLASIPSVSFILTMRGSQHPYEELVDWSLPRLPLLTQLDLGPAEEAFLRISPQSAGDVELPTLLRELDCMPLAITLMAKLASAGETVYQLLSQWRTERTEILGQVGGDRRTSIEVSIKLSLDSRAVKSNEDAIILLGIFSMLPGGAAVSRLPYMCPSMPKWNSALRVLLNAALVHRSADRSFIQVLSPIRSYAMLHHPLEEGPQLRDLRVCYYELAKKGKSQPGDPDFLTNVKELSAEETSMEAILIDALRRKGDVELNVLQASQDYSNYLYWTQPRTDVIEMAVQVARDSQSGELAGCLQYLGLILGMLAQHDAAGTILKEAQVEYANLGNRSGAANCLRLLGDILRVQTEYVAAETALKKAQEEFISLGDPLNAAYCLRSLGDTLRIQSQYEAARTPLEEAQSEFIRLGNPLGAAYCLRSLGEILMMQSRYDAALTTLKEAQAEFVSLGHRLGVAECLRSIGDVLIAQAQYDAAQTAVKEAHAEFISLGNRMCAAHCLSSLAQLLMLQAQYDAAQTVLKEARADYIGVGDRVGAATCLTLLGQILGMQTQYDAAQKILKEAQAECTSIGDRLGATQCLCALGEIMMWQTQYDAACTALKAAQREYISLGNDLGVADCLCTLGESLIMQGQYEEARSAVKEAQTRYINLGVRLGAAECLRLSGDILWMEKHYDEARISLKEAQGEFTSLEYRSGIAKCLRSLGRVLQVEMQYDAAWDTLTEANTIFVAIEDRFGTANCLFTLGRISRIQGRFDEAIKQFEEAQKLYSIIGRTSDAQLCSEESSLASAGDTSA